MPVLALMQTCLKSFIVICDHHIPNQLFLQSPVITLRTTMFNIQKFYLPPTQGISTFVYVSKQTAIISL